MSLQLSFQISVNTCGSKNYSCIVGLAFSSKSISSTFSSGHAFNGKLAMTTTIS